MRSIRSSLAIALSLSCQPAMTQENPLELRIDGPGSSAGTARLAIDVRCSCLSESRNGPDYRFEVRGEDVSLVELPVYDREADVYRGELRFTQPGLHRVEVRVFERYASVPIQANEVLVEVPAAR